MAYFTLQLDKAVEFTSQKGMGYSKHASDFRMQSVGSDSVFHDSETGLVFLAPSVFGRDYYEDIVDPTEWRKGEDAWKDAQRSLDQAAFMSTVVPAGTGDVATLLEIEINTALVMIHAATGYYDSLVWALESNFHLKADESFAIHYHGITDELLRKNNLMALQWDNLYLHFSGQGKLRVYRWEDRNNMTANPTLWKEVDFAQPSELLNINGYFVFIPVPGHGLLMMHRYQSRSKDTLLSSATATTSRSILIPLPFVTNNDDVNTLFSESPLRVALNPYHPHLIAMQRVKFASSGTFMDAPYDPNYPLYGSPGVAAGYLWTKKQGVSVAFRKVDDSGAWDYTADKAGCVKATLSTNDTTYTPFYTGYSLEWAKVSASRFTTPFTLNTTSGASPRDKITYLEFSQDDIGRYEGRVEAIIETEAGKAAVERGDTTYVLSYTLPGSATVYYLGAGFAKDFDIMPEVSNGVMYYKVAFTLTDMWERFREWHAPFVPAVDAQPVLTAINTVLRLSGFDEVTSSDAFVNNKNLPPVRPNNGWRFQQREGDTGEDMLRTLLMFLRAQNTEYRLVFDPSYGNSVRLGKWILEAKPRNTTDVWGGYMTGTSDNDDLYFRYQDGARFRIEPPIANVVQVYGVTSAEQSRATRIQASAKNKASLATPSAVNYLGRDKHLQFTFDSTDQDEIDRIARLLIDIASQRSVVTSLRCPDFLPALTPASCVRLYDLDDVQMFSNFWVKRRTFFVDKQSGGSFASNEQMVLELDTVWETKL